MSDFILPFICCGLVYFIGFNTGYSLGQEDYLKGKIKYELVTVNEVIRKSE